MKRYQPKKKKPVPSCTCPHGAHIGCYKDRCPRLLAMRKTEDNEGYRIIKAEDGE